MTRPRISAVLAGLSILAAPIALADAASATVITPPGDPMIGGTVTCVANVQTLRYWIHVSNTSAG